MEKHCNLRLVFTSLCIMVLFLVNSVSAQNSGPSNQETPPQVKVEKAPSSQVQEQVSTLGSDEMIGGIDWENRVVYAVGDGVPPKNAISPAQARARAKRAAMDEAYARLLETVQEVRVDAESTTRNFVNENRTVHTKVTGLVKNAEIYEMKQASDGSYQVKMRMPMTGMKGLSSAILPVELAQVRSVQIVSHTVRQIPGAKTPQPATNQREGQQGMSKADEHESKSQGSASSSTDQAKASPASTTRYTSLIIDGKGLNAKPALYPVIQSKSGKVVYNLEMANPNATIQEGLCTYKKSLDEARKLSKAGTNPLIIKAVGVGGKYGVDLLISDEDAEKVAAAARQANFLRDANVIVVVD